MIFIHICKKDVNGSPKYLTKIVFAEGEKWKWATTTEAVHNWAKKNFKENDEVDVEYTKKNGQYFVTKIMKPGSRGTSQKPEAKPKPEENSKPTCADCGKTLKDDKYEKCYTCNQKNPAKNTGSGKPDYKNGAPYGSLLPEEATRRNKLSVLSASVTAIQVLTGHVNDINVLGDMVSSLYDKFMKKIKG